jgi:hypothetical protein
MAQFVCEGVGKNAAPTLKPEAALKEVARPCIGKPKVGLHPMNLGLLPVAASFASLFSSI